MSAAKVKPAAAAIATATAVAPLQSQWKKSFALPDLIIGHTNTGVRCNDKQRVTQPQRLSLRLALPVRCL